jgi:hypothetical protein
MRRSPLLVAATLALVACNADIASTPLTPSAPSYAAASTVSNAQSIMVALDQIGPFQIVGTEIWAFDHAAAESYFTLTVSGPVVSCQGSPTACSNPAPASPGAPAPNNGQLTATASQNSCIFWDGGALTGGSYTQFSSVNVGSGSTQRTYKYLYTYNLDPNVGSVAPQTAWTLQSSDLTVPNATIGGYIVGLSTQARSSGNWNLKASFTINDGLGGTRVTDLNAAVTDPSAVTTNYPLLTTLGASNAFTYLSNAGTFGPISQLFENAAPAAIVGGTALSNGGGLDNFPGNNADVAETAVITPATVPLSTAGAYTVVITGTVKGNSGGLSQPFSASSSIIVDAGSCTAP